MSSYFAAGGGSCLNVGENAVSGKCNKAKHNKTKVFWYIALKVDESSPRHRTVISWLWIIGLDHMDHMVSAGKARGTEEVMQGDGF